VHLCLIRRDTSTDSDTSLDSMMTSDHSEATLSPAESHELETNVPLAAAAEITTDGNLEDPSENITSSEMNPEGDCVDMEMCRDNAVPVLSVDSAVNAEADECEVTASRALLVESDELETNIPVAAEVLTDGNLEDPPENVTTSELNPAGECVDMNSGDSEELCRDDAVPSQSLDSAMDPEADQSEVTASCALLVESDELETNIPVAAEVLTDGNLEGPPENVTTSELNPAGDCVDMTESQTSSCRWR